MIHFYIPNRLDSSTFGSLIQTVKDLKSGFYITRTPIIVPYSSRPTNFILEVSDDLLGYPIQIVRNDQEVMVVIPRTFQTTISLSLVKGFNRIKLRSTTGQTFDLYVGATHYATILQGIAHELFNNVQIPLDVLHASLESPWNPRINEWLPPWINLLPDSNALRIAATRISIRAAFNEAGTQRGVLDFLSALTAQTPIAVRLKNDTSYYDPILNLLYNSPTEFAGSEFHIWLPNSCVATWQALPKLVSNVSVYRLIEVKDEQIRLSFQARDENHMQELGSYECGLSNMVDLLDCFYNIWTWVKLSLRMAWSQCVYNYPLDTSVEAPLGFQLMDLGYPLDNPMSLDIIDPDDPLGDGWIRLGLDCRNDSTRTFNPRVVAIGDGAQSTFSGSLYEPVLPEHVQVFLKGILYGIDDPTSSTFVASPGWGDIFNPATGVVFGAIEYSTGRWILNTLSQLPKPLNYETVAIAYIRSPAGCYDTTVRPATSLYSSVKACESDPIFCGAVQLTTPHVVSPDNILFCPAMAGIDDTIAGTRHIAQCVTPCCDGPCVTLYHDSFSEIDLTLPTQAGVGLVP